MGRTSRSKVTAGSLAAAGGAACAVAAARAKHKPRTTTSDRISAGSASREEPSATSGRAAAGSRSVIEQKLLRVQQRPEQIFQAHLRVGGARHQLLGLHPLC